MLSLIQLTPNMDSNTLTSTLNNNLQQIESENRTKVIKDEDGVNRVLLGRNPSGKYGLYITKPGIDVMKELENG